jgi:hypothetical protein
VTRPRKPFGANHPGRLPATMMKVLAAEMTDPSRLRRGKQYAKDGSVLDIVIDPGTVTCEIQGSRSTPYIAVVSVTPGDGMPLRRDVQFTCTCPDNDNWDDYACKHVVATMFTLSDEFLLEPELLDLWRGHAVDGPGGDGAGEDRDDGDQYDGPGGDGAGEDRDDGGRRRGHLRLVGDRERAERPAPRVDPLAELLRFPEGTELPDVGEIDRIEPQLPRSRELAGVLRDAIGNLRIEWD